MRQSPLLAAILAALAGCAGTETRAGSGCMDVPSSQTTCPAKAEIKEGQLYISGYAECGDQIDELTGDGKREDGFRTLSPSGMVVPVSSCCYPVEIVHHDAYCGTPGRPYFEDGRVVLAPLCSSRGRAEREPSPRAVAWARAGAAEHASVAAFSRLALELMALGAPSDLLRAAHQAALDEVGHAELCFALAEASGYARVSPQAFPIRDVKLAPSLAALARAAVREGCLSETLGAEVTLTIAELAPDPEVRAALSSIAREEATHAVLSFRIVAWALQVGGVDVERAVRAAFEEPWPTLDTEELALRAEVSRERVAEATVRAVNEVLAPAAARLLAA